MNPDLVKATRSALTAQANAQKQGQTISDSDLEAFIREETKGKFGWSDAKSYADKLRSGPMNAITAGVQGFSANFGDEIVGMLPEFLGGGEANKEEMRLRGDMFSREHPVGNAAAQAAGGVGMALLLPEVKAATLAAKALQGGRIGALLGGANGVGGGENLQDRAIGAAAGTVAGGLMGEAVPKIMAGLKGLAAPLTNLFPKAAPVVAHAADLSMPPNSAPVTQVVSPLERASANVQKAIENMGGYGKVRAANEEMRAAGRGSITTLADLGKPFTKAADFAANNSEAAHNAISDLVDTRGAGTTQRVIDDFKGEVGDVHAPSRQAQLASETKDWADGPDGYGTRTNGLGLRASNPDISLGDAEPLVNQPRVRNLWADAKAAGRIGAGPDVGAQPIDMDALVTEAAKAYPGINVDALRATLSDPMLKEQLMGHAGATAESIASGKGTHSLDNVMDLMQSMKDAAGSAYAAGKNNLGERMKSAATVVQKTLEDHVPGFADISDKYAERKGLERALQAGQDRFHTSSDITGMQQEMSKLTPAELAEYRTGLAHEQLLKLQSTSGANAATKTMIAKNDPARTAMLKIVFGDEATFDRFMLKAKAERRLGALGTAVGGSQTHARGAAAAASDGAVVNTLGHGTSMSLQHKLTAAAMKAVVGPMRERAANDMLPQLMTQGSDAIDELLARLEANQPKAPGNGATKVAPATMSSLFGSQAPRDRM